MVRPQTLLQVKLYRLRLSSNAPSTFPIGVTNVTWTAKDGSDNTATCTQKVTVVDNQVPVLTAPSNQTLNTTDACSASYTIVDPIADNCTGTTWSYSLSGATSGSQSSIADGTSSSSISFNQGLTTVTLTGIDVSGNAAVQKTFTVTVNDNENPVVTPPSNISLCGAQAVTFTGITAATATDNCGIASISYSPASGSTFNVGTTTVTATATDVTGLMGTATFTVTINPYPTAYAVTGGGAYCMGGSGVTVDLANSQTGIDYQLQKDGTNTGSPVSGNDSGITFGNQTAAGTYTVVATTTSTGCTAAMTGNAVVTINPLTEAGTASSNQTICSGLTPTAITLTGNVGTVTKWQSSLDNFATAGSDISNTTTTLTLGALTATTSYRAVVQSGACSAENSNAVTITVNPNNTVSAASSTPSLCIHSALTPITHTTTVTTGIGTATGLPTGVTASWAADVITISGTPSASGTFNYSIPLLGCGGISATGTIIVTTSATTVCASGCNFTTIQNAIDASCEDGVITISDGTYNEDVIISKNVTFSLSNDNTVTINKITINATKELKHNKSFVVTTEVNNNGIYTSRGFVGKLINNGKVAPKQ